MDWKPMAAWPFNPGGGVAEPYTMQLPARVRKVIDPTYWDNTSLIPIDVAAGILLRQYIPDIANFVQRQRQRYSLGLVEYHRARATAPQLVVDYINNNGQEIITYIVQPTTSSSIQGNGIIIVGGDPRDSDGATVVWFNEGSNGLAEYANNAGAKIQPDYTGLTFGNFGDGTTPVPDLPASCISLGLARGNWSVATWSYTQSQQGDVRFSGPYPPHGNIIYDKTNATILPVAPTPTTGLIAGVGFTTDTSTSYNPPTSYGVLFTLDHPDTFIFRNGNAAVTLYTEADQTGLKIIDGGEKYEIDLTGIQLSVNSILPSGRFGYSTGNSFPFFSPTLSVQDKLGNSYLIETDSGNGIFAVKRDKNGAQQWEFSLNYEDLSPVGIARTNNYIAILCTPPTHFVEEGTPSWGINSFDQPGLFTPPHWELVSDPYTTSGAALAVISASDRLVGSSVFTMGFASGNPNDGYPADGKAIAAFLTAAQSGIGDSGGKLAACVYGSNSHSASISHLPSKILVVSAKDGTLVQTLPWGTPKLDIIPIPGDVSASVVSPHGLWVAACAPNY